MKHATLPLIVALLSPSTKADTIVDLAIGEPSLSTLVTAVTQAELVDALSDTSADLTVFAPNNDAFAKIDPDYLAALLTEPYSMHLSEILLNHVIAGSAMSGDLSDGMMLNTSAKNGMLTVSVASNGTVSIIDGTNATSMVVSADIMAENGVVHVVDGVLLPSFVAKTLTESLSDEYSTLLSVLELTGLSETLNAADPPYTLFAPNNDAFAAIPKDDLDALLADTMTLTNILLYHVTDMIPSTSLPSEGMLESLYEKKLLNITKMEETVNEASKMEETIMVNDAMVVQGDILSANGIAHGINKVLMPPGDGGSMPAPAPDATSDATVALGAKFYLPFMAVLLWMG
jgi:transforming growth factor-beta-induced protein